MTTKTDTPDDIAAAEKLERLNANLAKMDELSKRLVAAMGKKKSADPGLQAPGQEVYMQAAAAYMAEMMNNPSKILEQQVSYWGKSLKHYVDAQQPFVHGKIAAPEDKGPTDRRFKSELWDTHPYFNFIKQQYM